MADKVVINLATGLEDTERVTVAFLVGNAAVDKGKQVSMFLTKEAVFDEIDRVLRPGGRLQLADVVIHHEVSEDARKRIDLWTG